MYRNEAQFSRALVPVLKKLGIVTRIESGTTQRGIPDILFANKDGSTWIELKNDSRIIVGDTIQVHWRQGQQAFMYEWQRRTGRACLTVIAGKGCFIIVPMTKRFSNNFVQAEDYVAVGRMEDVVRFIRGHNNGTCHIHKEV